MSILTQVKHQRKLHYFWYACFCLKTNDGLYDSFFSTFILCLSLYDLTPSMQFLLLYYKTAYTRTPTQTICWRSYSLSLHAFYIRKMFFHWVDTKKSKQYECSTELHQVLMNIFSLIFTKTMLNGLAELIILLRIFYGISSFCDELISIKWIITF